MSQNPARSPLTVDGPLATLLFAAELSFLVVLLAGTRAAAVVWSTRLSSVTLILSAVLLAVFVFAAIRRVRALSSERSRTMYLTVALNVFSVVSIFLSGEIVIRMLSVPLGDVLFVRETQLNPRAWGRLVELYEPILDSMTEIEYYIEQDSDLGWVPGPNRSSKNGLYSTSAEGVRSARPGVSFMSPDAAGSDDEIIRVALVGDSFTFGIDVQFEDSWGYLLSESLGPGYQVLNFGVPGYGVDQTYLRCLRDAIPWKPHIIVFGFIDEDLKRSLTLYRFITSPGWGYPFSKPRFVFEGDELRLVNQPTVTPREMYSKPSVAGLPFLEYESGYDADDWHASVYHRSELVRFLGEWFAPPNDRGASDRNMNAWDVNEEILQMFLRLARSQDAMPALVYFPTIEMTERIFDGAVPDSSVGRDLLHATAAQAEVHHVDMLERFQRIEPIPMRAMEWRMHYSPEANAVVASQMEELIRSMAPHVQRSGLDVDSTGSEP